MEYLFLLIPFITGGVSALHGGDYLRSKWVIIVLHFFSLFVIIHLNIHNWVGVALLSLVLTAIYWLIFRTGGKSKAELSALAVPNSSTLTKTIEEYLIPLGLVISLNVTISTIFIGNVYAAAMSLVPALFIWVPYWSCKTFNFGAAVWPPTERNLHIQGKCRRKVEFIIGVAPVGLAMATLAYNICLL